MKRAFTEIVTKVGRRSSIIKVVVARLFDTSARAAPPATLCSHVCLATLEATSKTFNVSFQFRKRASAIWRPGD